MGRALWVATLRTEHAGWDLAREQWQPARGRASTSFRPDGTVSANDFFNPDRSIVHSRWFYDAAGRLTETTSQFNDGPIDRTAYSYGSSWAASSNRASESRWYADDLGDLQLRRRRQENESSASRYRWGGFGLRKRRLGCSLPISGSDDNDNHV